jgi:methylated-DNA-protein-cysteine methyltransferase-like protein
VCLKNLPSPSTDRSKKDATFHSGNVPWQRVLNAKGSISIRSVPRAPAVLCCLLFIVPSDKGQRSPSRQADALRREGVEVREDAMHQCSVNLATFGWFPAVLPSESSLVESSEEEDEEAAAYHT